MENFSKPKAASSAAHIWLQVVIKLQERRQLARLQQGLVRLELQELVPRGQLELLEQEQLAFLVLVQLVLLELQELLARPAQQELVQLELD